MTKFDVLVYITIDNIDYVVYIIYDITSDMQDMMWGESDLAGTAVDLGNDAEFGIIAVDTWMFS